MAFSRTSDSEPSSSNSITIAQRTSEKALRKRHRHGDSTKPAFAGGLPLAWRLLACWKKTTLNLSAVLSRHDANMPHFGAPTQFSCTIVDLNGGAKCHN
jgi:hypothetical protein